MIAGAAAGLVCVVVAALVERRLLATRRDRVVARVAPAGGRRRAAGGHELRLRPPARLVAAAARADLRRPPADLWTAWVAGLVVVPLAAAVAAGVPAAIVAAVVAALAPAGLLGASGHRAAGRYDGALPAALEAVSRALRSGASIQFAVREASAAAPGAVGADLDRVATAVAGGASFADALASWACARPAAGVRLTVASLSLGTEAGGATARAVDGVAATLRERLTVRAELRALASQAKASAAVLVAAPVVFCVIASIADPTTADTLLRTPIGLACLVGGLSLDAAGAFWMHRIVRGVS